MKAYLIVTGMLFALLTLLHIWRIVVEWSGVNTNVLIIGSATLVTLALSIWAWRLLPRVRKPTR